MKTLRIAAAFARRDVAVAISYRVPLVVEVVGSIFMLISFRLIADLVGTKGHELAGGDYFGYAVVGLAFSVALLSAVNGPVSSIRQEQVLGSLEALASTSLTAPRLAVGLSTYPLLQGIAQALIVLAVAGIGFGLPLGGGLAAAIPALALTSLAFLAIGLSAAAVVLVFQQGAFLAQWATASLAFLSGAYFPLSLLPGWARFLAEASPLTHALRAVRGVLLEGKGIFEVAGDLAALAAFSVVLLPVGIGVMSVALARSRRTGSLAQY